jgi:two-component system cell cycle response regulator DivK
MPTVLLVEDNEMNRDMLSRRLTRLGFHVLMATDGEQGVEMAKTHLPDLILDSNGYEPAGARWMGRHAAN